jgi:putative permease
MIRSNSSIEKLRLIFFAIITFVFLWTFFLIPRLALPFCMAYIIAIFIEKLIPPFKKLSFGREFSIWIFITLIISLTLYPMIKFFPIIKDEFDNLKYYLPKIEILTKGYYSNFANAIKVKTGIEIDEALLVEALDYLRESSKIFLLNIPTILASLVEWNLLVPFFLYFILKEKKNFLWKFLQIIPNSIFERTYILMYKFNKNLGNYIYAKFLEAFIIGLITISGLLFLEIRFAFLLGLAAAIASVVPYIGPFLGVIPALSICLIEYGITKTTGAMLLLYFIANFIDVVFVFPLLVSKIVDIHPIIVVVSVILGSQYAGIAGMIVSIPCAVVCKLLFAEVYRDLYPNYGKEFDSIE